MTKKKKEIRIDCPKHGSSPRTVFTSDKVILKIVCFVCWVEKITKGLVDYK